MKELVHSLLDRPIAFHRAFVTLTGSVNAALLLSQAIYWSKRTTLPDNWFWKSQDEWQEETGLSRHEQLTARRKLESLNLLEATRIGRRAGSDLHYKVNIDAVYSGLVEIAQNASTTMPDDGNAESISSDDKGKQTAGKRQSGIQENESREYDVEAVPLTEITTENTTTTTTDLSESCGSSELKLIFPKKVILSQQNIITELLSGYPDQAQQIVDELAGRMRIINVKNPIRYVRGILENIGENKFEPELALGVAEERAAHKKREEANREAQKKMESHDSTTTMMSISAKKEQISNLRDILKKGGK